MIPQEDWAALDWEQFTLTVKLGNEAMKTRDDVAKALRHAADALQAGLADEGAIRDDNGNRVGGWSFEDDPRRFDGDCFAFRGKLEVYAKDEQEARELAVAVCANVGDGWADDSVAKAPPALKLPAIHGHLSTS